MTLSKKIKFLNQCKNNDEKLNFYLDMSNSDISCGPCLVLKCYYKWCMKFLFKAEVKEAGEKEFFRGVIDKLDYKVIGNMEYEDIKSITAAYYALGELYLKEKDIENAKLYFSKVIEVMEEFLKTGNRFQTQEVQAKNGIVLFEILMWARKSLGEIVEPEEALALYDSIIAEEELLYLEKYNSILMAAMTLNKLEKVNEAVKAMMKIMPDYNESNKTAVEYLISAEDYSNAIDIIIDEYNRQGINHWINLMNNLCKSAKELNITCTKKVIGFAQILIEELKVTEWSNLMLTLYRGIRNYKEQSLLQLNYMRTLLLKVNYIHKDFVNYSDAILVLYDIYEDIRRDKYDKEYLREYEFDFTFFLLNATIQNNSNEKAVEAATKLEAIIKVLNTNNKLQDYLRNCVDLALENIKTEEYSLVEYPWYYLFEEMNKICCSLENENSITENCKIKNSSNKIIVGINTISNEKVEAAINKLVGESILNQQGDFVLVANNEDINISSKVKEKYNYSIISKASIIPEGSIIMTSSKDTILDLSDKNVVLVNGNNELRDVDITYIRHIISKDNNAKIIMLLDSSKEEYSKEITMYNTTILQGIVSNESLENSIDLAEVKSPKELFNLIVGDIPKEIVSYRFGTFEHSINNKLCEIDNHRKIKNEKYKKEIYSLREAIEDYDNLLEDSSTTSKEFILKIQGDLEFLGTYAAEKMSLMIPDVIEKNLDNIDDIEDVTTLKASAEKVFSEAIISWCNKNIYNLLLEQFKVCIARYSSYYGYHEEAMTKFEDNRARVSEINDDFAKNIKELKSITFEEVKKEMLDIFNEGLNEIDYKVIVIPNDKFINSVTDSLKGMFMKAEAKTETSKIKIKNQVIANKENLGMELGQSVCEKLKKVEENLIRNIQELFKNVMDTMEDEKNKTKDIITAMEKKQEVDEKNNDKVYETIGLLKVEVEKFKNQVSNKVLYSCNKCYRL